MSVPAAVIPALLGAAAMPLDLPPPPRPEEGYAALWAWLRATNSALSIPDLEFRWMFGGLSVSVLLLFEVVGIRKDWRLYPFLLPFWLVFGSIAFGVVGGLAAAAAHLVLFPVGRLWFAARERRRPRSESERASAPAHALAPPRRAGPARPARTAQEAIAAALSALRTAAARERGTGGPAAGGPGRPAEPTLVAVLRALGEAAAAAAAAGRRDRPDEHRPDRPEERPRAPIPEHREAATGAPPGKPDLSAFRPDLSRFRRRPPGR